MLKFSKEENNNPGENKKLTLQVGATYLTLVCETECGADMLLQLLNNNVKAISISMIAFK